MNAQTRLEEQKKEIDKKLAVLKNSSIKGLAEISVEEKCAAFDLIYARTRQHLDAVMDDKGRDDDEHYIYEEAMEATLGKKVFDVIGTWD